MAQQWSDQDLLDAQCIAIYASRLGENSEGPDTAGLIGLVAYYVGKIEGRNPGFDLTQIITKEFVKTIEADRKAITHRCSQEGIVYGQRMIDAGEVLQQAGI